MLLADSQQWQRFSDPVRPPNAARYLFLDPRAKVFYADWNTVAHDIVAAMRSEAGARPVPLLRRKLSSMLPSVRTARLARIESRTRPSGSARPT